MILDSLYPFKMAEYMTVAMVRSAPKSDVLSAVDSTFRPVKEEKTAVKISLPQVWICSPSPDVWLYTDWLACCLYLYARGFHAAQDYVLPPYYRSWR